jgi:hypothetical protein
MPAESLFVSSPSVPSPFLYREAQWQTSRKVPIVLSTPFVGRQNTGGCRPEKTDGLRDMSRDGDLVLEGFEGDRSDVLTSHQSLGRLGGRKRGFRRRSEVLDDAVGM